jgi:hypothetical protein
MEIDQRSVLFLDGIGCNPAGFKPRFLADLGYRMTAPELPDLDFSQALAIADSACLASTPDVIVGYSRGAALALMMADRVTPRVLIAPALTLIEDDVRFTGRLVILHSATDDSLPLFELRERLMFGEFPTAELRIVGTDHSMIDPASLSALEVALIELAEGRTGSQ